MDYAKCQGPMLAVYLYRFHTTVSNYYEFYLRYLGTCSLVIARNVFYTCFIPVIMLVEHYVYCGLWWYVIETCICTLFNLHLTLMGAIIVILLFPQFSLSLIHVCTYCMYDDDLIKSINILFSSVH